MGGFAVFSSSTLAIRMSLEHQSIEKLDSLLFHLCWPEKVDLLSLLFQSAYGGHTVTGLGVS